MDHEPDEEKKKLAPILGEWGLTLYEVARVRKVWRLKTEAGFLCLKPSRLSSLDLLFVERLVAHARQGGFTRAAAAIPTRDGHHFVAAGGFSYLLFPWFAGREAAFAREDALLAAIVPLAAFHRAGSGFIPYRSDPARVRWGTWPVLLAARLAQLYEFGERARMLSASPFGILYARLFSHYVAQAEEALRLLKVSPYEELAEEGARRRMVCHHDPSPRNFILDEEGRAFLLDFEYALADLRLHDLANLLLRLLRRHGWRPEVARKVIGAYHRENPLDERELAVLYPFLLWPQDFWQIGRQFFAERLPWPSERFFETLHRRTVDREERGSFLDWYKAEDWRPAKLSFSSPLFGPPGLTMRRDFPPGQLEISLPKADLPQGHREGQGQGEFQRQLLAEGDKPGGREALSGRFDLHGHVTEGSSFGHP
ncbi:MAG: CotS family spore coat protein [Firmicutes bacterium]|nr:CotS family spore coat protein [Bacillota bacterium]